MKLVDLNKDFEDAVDKYSSNKAGLNKEIGTSNPDKNEMPMKSGNNEIDPAKKKMLGTDALGSRNGNKPPNLAV